MQYLINDEFPLEAVRLSLKRHGDGKLHLMGQRVGQENLISFDLAVFDSSGEVTIVENGFSYLGLELRY